MTDSGLCAAKDWNPPRCRVISSPYASGSGTVNCSVISTLEYISSATVKFSAALLSPTGVRVRNGKWVGGITPGEKISNWIPLRVGSATIPAGGITNPLLPYMLKKRVVPSAYASMIVTVTTLVLLSHTAVTLVWEIRSDNPTDRTTSRGLRSSNPGRVMRTWSPTLRGRFTLILTCS